MPAGGVALVTATAPHSCPITTHDAPPRDVSMQVLASQPDHLTWVTQDVFALSIVVMEWLTFGMFTYPYNREEPSPSYSHLLLFELERHDKLDIR